YASPDGAVGEQSRRHSGENSVGGSGKRRRDVEAHRRGLIRTHEGPQPRNWLRAFVIPGAGFEPACLAALDFESSASTIPPSRRGGAGGAPATNPKNTGK